MLINDATQSPPQVPAQAPASPDAAPTNPKDILKKLGQVAMKLIYNENASENLIDMMREGKESLPLTVARAAMQILEHMKKSVTGINPNVVDVVGSSVVILLLELGALAKVIQVDAKTVKDSLNALAALTKQSGQPAPAEPPTIPATASAAVPAVAPAAAPQPVGV